MNAFKDYKIIKEISSGESLVLKYLVEKDNEEYLLRLYDPRFMEDRFKAFNNIKILNANNVSVPKLYDYGISPELNKGYSIIEWIKGTTLTNLLVDEESSIQYGKQAANELLKLHNQNNLNKVNIYEEYLSSFYRKLDKIKNLKINIDIEQIKQFVLDNSYILKQYDSSIIHRDFHPGNIIVNNDKLYLIDLDVCRSGFAWEDLSTNACNMYHPDFYTSVTNEYFNNNIPSDFWTVYKLYGILHCLGYIIYCNRAEDKDINYGIEVLNNFLDYTDNFNLEKPKWFNERILRKE